MNYKKIIIPFACLSILTGVAACDVQNNHDNKKHTENTHEISNKKFATLPYHEYYSKSDLAYDVESKSYHLKNEKTQLKAEKNAATNGTNATYSKTSKAYTLPDGSVKSADYSIKKEQVFSSPPLKLRVNNSNIYNFDTIAKNQLSKNIPVKTKLKPDKSITITPKYNAQGTEYSLDDEKGGIVKLDITAKNKSPHAMSVGDIIQLDSKQLNQSEPIAGRITIDGTSYGDKDLISNHLGREIPSNGEMNATIYYLVNEDVHEGLDLVSTYIYGYPLDEQKQFIVKTDVR